MRWLDEQLALWRTQPIAAVYPVAYIDGMHVDKVGLDRNVMLVAGRRAGHRKSRLRPTPPKTQNQTYTQYLTVSQEMHAVFFCCGSLQWPEGKFHDLRLLCASIPGKLTSPPTTQRSQSHAPTASPPSTQPLPRPVAQRTVPDSQQSLVTANPYSSTSVAASGPSRRAA